MEERVKSIKEYIDGYLIRFSETGNDEFQELAARWSQYLKEISGIKYRETECGIWNR